jgi:hypothetical protein
MATTTDEMNKGHRRGITTTANEQNIKKRNNINCC